jgi:hydrogenase nickel incorporation protein HypA/HybF
MHELHLMSQVVKTVESELHGTGTAKLSAVRLKIRALSHLLTADYSALQAAFVLAARGTKAEGATLEIIPVPQNARCSGCGRDTTVTGPGDVCAECGELVIGGSSEPEVVVHELVVQE